MSYQRHLAYQDKTQWSEYWEFLGEFCDFSKPDGLEKLERYLGGRASDSVTEDLEQEDPILDSVTSKHLILRNRAFLMYCCYR